MSIFDRFRQQAPPKPDIPPRGASGRGHTNGFLDREELNNDLHGQQGLAVFDKMYRTDGDIRQNVGMVCNPVGAGTWEIIPHGGSSATAEDIDNAKFVEWALFDNMSPNIKDHISECLPVLVRAGFAPYEELWTVSQHEGKDCLVPRKLELRLPRSIWRWYQDEYGDLFSIVQQLKVPVWQLTQHGPPGSQFYANARYAIGSGTRNDTLSPNEVEILADNLIYYRLGGEGDNWEGVSLLRPAYKHWVMKDAIERIDAIAQEREAMGVPICYPPPGATPGQLDKMEMVLKAMRTNEQGYIIAPGPKSGQGASENQGWLIEVLGYDRTGSGRDPQPSLAYHTHKIAAAFIAEFMQLGHGSSGARATAAIQANPFLLSVEALVSVVEGQLQKLVNQIIAYNRPDAVNAPKIRMSLVDASSISDLADYVLKLVQVGAMLPDQELEDFLRARADLPPSDPEAVSTRKTPQADDDRRKEVVAGGPGGGTPFGNGSQKEPQKSPTRKSLDRYRPLHPQEEVVNFDKIEQYLDDLPNLFHHSLQGHVMSAASRMAHGSKYDRKQLASAMESCLSDCYYMGFSDVTDELSRLNGGGMYLDNIRDKGPQGLKDRAEHAVNYILSAMELGTSSTRMNHGDTDYASMQSTGETEGLRAVRHVAMGHGTGAYSQGRHDTILAAADDGLGVLYTALLDGNTCTECAQADDGMVRALNDPVRLDRRPPNRHCLSTNSGHNYCRCFEVPATMGV